MITWRGGEFPIRPEKADENGLVAVGGGLHPDLVLSAYRAGIFPWSSDPAVTWWSPDPRAVFDLETFAAHRTIGRTVRRNGWRFSVDRDFSAVMRACAAPAPGRESTWISDDFLAAYEELHRRGNAHSIEVWEGDELIGGLYGVTVGAFFGGESMFHRRPDGSKAALAFLVARLRACGFLQLDGQVPNPHLTRLGAVEWPRAKYLAALKLAIAQPATLFDGPRSGVAHC